MEYETLYLNDNGTAKVRMTIDDHVLEQDFATDDLDANVKQGMAVFRADLARNQAPTPEFDIPLNEPQKVLVKDLPVIPPEDFLPEQPEGE